MEDIQQEKRKSFLPWLLLILGVLAAAWFFFFREHKEPVPVENKALIDVHENNATVAAYVTFINSDTNKLSLDHAYSSEALTKLTDAVDAMATEAGYDVKVDIAQAKPLAEEITKDPLVTTHADKIRSAAELLSTSLQNLQQAKYPELSAEAAETKTTATAINPETLTLDQRDAVKAFFKSAADLLNKMN